MLAKATLITGWFMHLRHEQRFFTGVFVGTTILTVLFLYFLMVPDGNDRRTKNVEPPVAERSE